MSELELLIKAIENNPEAVYLQRCGFLYVRLHSEWVLRWCVCGGGALSASTSPKEEPLPMLSNLLDTSSYVSHDLPTHDATGMPLLAFRVVAMTGGSHIFATDSEESRERWIRALSRAGRPMALSDMYQVDWSAPLGSGLFAVVFRARKVWNGDTCAVKMVKPEAYRRYREMLDTEFRVWAAVGAHPNVLQLKDVMRSQSRMYFVSELCQGGGLLDYLAATAASRGGWSESDAARVMRQVLEGLGHIHSRGVVHCDVKPENICLTSKAHDATVKIIDFGMATFHNCPMEPGGTPEFVAPELVLLPQQYAAHGCGPEVDVWSAGVLLFYLLSGHTPFVAPSQAAIVARVKSGVWAFKGSRWADVSDQAKSLVSKMLQVKPASRPTVREALQHPWFGASGAAASRRPLAAAGTAFQAQATAAAATAAAAAAGAQPPSSAEAAAAPAPGRISSSAMECGAGWQQQQQQQQQQQRQRQQRSASAAVYDSTSMVEAAALSRLSMQHATAMPLSWGQQMLQTERSEPSRSRHSFTTMGTWNLAPPQETSPRQPQPDPAPATACLRRRNSSIASLGLGMAAAAGAGAERWAASGQAPGWYQQRDGLERSCPLLTMLVPPGASLSSSERSSQTQPDAGGGGGGGGGGAAFLMRQSKSAAWGGLSVEPGGMTMEAPRLWSWQGQEHLLGGDDKGSWKQQQPQHQNHHHLQQQQQHQQHQQRQHQQHQQQQHQQHQGQQGQTSSERLRQIQQLQEQVLELKLAVAAKGAGAGGSYLGSELGALLSARVSPPLPLPVPSRPQPVAAAAAAAAASTHQSPRRTVSMPNVVSKLGGKSPPVATTGGLSTIVDDDDEAFSGTSSAAASGSGVAPSIGPGPQDKGYQIQMLQQQILELRGFVDARKCQAAAAAGQYNVVP